MKALFESPALILVILIGLSLIACLGAFLVQKLRKKAGKTVSVQARFLSSVKTGGSVEMIGERGRIASGNTFVQVSFYRLSFWCDSLQRELHFTTKNDEGEHLREGDEGILTYSKNVFLSFRKK